MRKILTFIVITISAVCVFLTPTASASPLFPATQGLVNSLPKTYVLAKTHSTHSHTHKSHSTHHSSKPHHYSSSRSSSSGVKANCDYPDQVDSAGRRCGKRAASVRAGGRNGGTA